MSKQSKEESKNNEDYQNSNDLEDEDKILYKILDVDSKADQKDIKARFRQLARTLHPDKNQDDPEAKQKFQKLNQAYQILSDPRKRQIYDRTGKISEGGVGDIGSFIDAYIYYREKYKEISRDDIEQFSKTYPGSEEEKEDLIDYFLQNDGFMDDLLHCIPLSKDEDLPRFFEVYENELEAGNLPSELLNNFRNSKDNVKPIEEEIDQKEADQAFEDLIATIRNKGDSRRLAIEDLAKKYITKPKNTKKQKKKIKKS